MSSLIEIYNKLCNRKSYLLNIIGYTNMSYYTIKTMNVNQLCIIFKMLNDPSIDDEELYWVTYQLNIWEKYRAHLELSFLNAQINYIHNLIK